MSTANHNLKKFKAKHVQGLYNFSHFEHKDGRWIQRSARGDKYIYSDAKGSMHEFRTIRALVNHMKEE